MWVIQAAYNYQIYLPNIFHAQQKVYVWRVLMHKSCIPEFKQLFLGLFFLVKRRNVNHVTRPFSPADISTFSLEISKLSCQETQI